MSTKLRFTDNPKYQVKQFSLTQGYGRIEGDFKMRMPKDMIFQEEIITKLVLIVGDYEWVMGDVFVSPRYFIEDMDETVECLFSCTRFYVRKIEK